MTEPEAPALPVAAVQPTASPPSRPTAPRRAPTRQYRALLRTIGANLRRHRLARGWSQAQVAQRAGLSADFVGDVERGHQGASLAVLQAWANALNVSLRGLFDPPEDSPAPLGPVPDARTVEEAISLARAVREGSTPRRFAAERGLSSERAREIHDVASKAGLLLTDRSPRKGTKLTHPQTELKWKLRDCEIQMILEALRSSTTCTQAARKLGLSSPNFSLKLTSLGIRYRPWGNASSFSPDPAQDPPEPPAQP